MLMCIGKDGWLAEYRPAAIPEWDLNSMDPEAILRLVTDYTFKHAKRVNNCSETTLRSLVKKVLGLVRP